VINTPTSAIGNEFRMSLKPVFWQYKESANFIPGFTGTPFASRGNGAELEASIGGTIDLINRWNVRIDAYDAISALKEKEYWSGKSSFQSNSMQISEGELSISANKRMDMLSIGLITSYVFQKQERSQFVVNGIHKNLPKVTEKIDVAWIGVRLSKKMYEDFRFSLNGFAPAYVNVKNSFVSGHAKNKKGYRISININSPLPWTISGGSSLVEINYEYRKLGNEIFSNNAYWPSNIFQRIGVGVAIYW